MQMPGRSVTSLPPNSPSFNNYSSGRLAEIAARVVEEFREESGFQEDIYETWPQQKRLQQEVTEEEDNEDDDFEFTFVCRDPEMSPISADEIFYNGQIRPMYPLFDTTLLNNIIDQTPNGKNVESTFESKPRRPHRLPLRKLMSEERETNSSSSSEAEELEGVTPGSYCVWKPKAATSANIGQESPGRCKKSNSTGSSKRWNLKDLLYRSNSDGKDTFVFLAPSKRDRTCNKAMEIPEKFKEADEHCGSNRETKAGEKRRSFMPYRQDLVGIFSNINGLSWNLHPF